MNESLLRDVLADVRPRHGGALDDADALAALCAQCVLMLSVMHGVTVGAAELEALIRARPALARRARELCPGLVIAEPPPPPPPPPTLPPPSPSPQRVSRPVLPPSTPPLPPQPLLPPPPEERRVRYRTTMRRLRRQVLECPVAETPEEALISCDLCLDYALQSRRYLLDSLPNAGNYYVTLSLRMLTRVRADFVDDAQSYYSAVTGPLYPRYMGHAFMHDTGTVTVCAVYFALPGDPEQIYSLVPTSDDDDDEDGDGGQEM